MTEAGLEPATINPYGPLVYGSRRASTNCTTPPSIFNSQHVASNLSQCSHRQPVYSFRTVWVRKMQIYLCPSSQQQYFLMSTFPSLAKGWREHRISNDHERASVVTLSALYAFRSHARPIAGSPPEYNATAWAHSQPMEGGTQDAPHSSKADTYYCW